MIQGPQAIYFENLAQSEFRIQRCDSCQRAVFYPRVLCPYCGSDDLSWITPQGTGVVHSTTTVRRKPEAGGPYNVALVDLTEGVRLMTHVACDNPEDVRIGMRVRFAHVGEDVQTVVFKPEANNVPA